jgi:hypothetical protein
LVDVALKTCVVSYTDCDSIASSGSKQVKTPRDGIWIPGCDSGGWKALPSLGALWLKSFRAPLIILLFDLDAMASRIGLGLSLLVS